MARPVRLRRGDGRVRPVHPADARGGARPVPRLTGRGAHRIVLDTDVVSLYRTGRLPARFAHHVATNDLSIAFATAGELWKWALARRWGDARRGGLELFLDQALILPANRKVAKVWGEMAAGAQRRGRPRPLNDTWIAACCIEGGLPLLTLNRRDFADFTEHDGLVLLGA